MRCSECGATYISPPLRADEAAALYTAGDWDVRRTAATRTNIFDFAERLMRQRLGKAGVVLDVGCSAGHFMSLAAERGWRPIGIDINEEAVAAARARGLQASIGRIEDLEPRGETFDCIVMMNTLECFNDPTSALRCSFALLREDGLLVIGMPNGDYHRWQTRIGRLLRVPRERLMIVAPTPAHYLVGFGPRALELLLRKVGFSPVEIMPAAARESGNIAERLLRRIIQAVSERLFAWTRKRVLLSPSMLVVSVKPAKPRETLNRTH